MSQRQKRIMPRKKRPLKKRLQLQRRLKIRLWKRCRSNQMT
jgi:hypothetical protein